VALHGVAGDLHAGADQGDDVVGFGQGGGDDVDAGDPGGGQGQDVQEGGEFVGDVGDLAAPLGQVLGDVIPPGLVVDAVALGLVQRAGAGLRGVDTVVVGVVGLFGQIGHAGLGVVQVGLRGVVRGLRIGHSLLIRVRRLVLLRGLQIGRRVGGVGGGALQIGVRVLRLTQRGIRLGLRGLQQRRIRGQRVRGFAIGRVQLLQPARKRTELPLEGVSSLTYPGQRRGVRAEAVQAPVRRFHIMGEVPELLGQSLHRLHDPRRRIPVQAQYVPTRWTCHPPKPPRIRHPSPPLLILGVNVSAGYQRRSAKRTGSG